MAWPDGEVLNPSGMLRMKRLSGAIPCSYGVFYYDGTYYAEPNIPDGTPYSGSDLYTVWESLRTALPSGGKIGFHKGTFDFGEHTMVVDNDFIICGEGRQTVFSFSGSVDRAIYMATSKNDIVLQDFFVDCTSMSAGNGIEMVGGVTNALSNVVVNSAPNDCLKVSGSGTTLYVDRCYLAHAGNDGMSIINNFHGVHVNNTVSEANTRFGLLITGICSGQFDSFWSEQNDDWAIYLGASAERVKFNNPRLSASATGKGHIYVHSSAHDIKIDGADCLTTDGSYSIEIVGDRVTVIGGTYDKTFSVSGSGHKFINVPVFVTENSGTSTGTGAEQTIAHGLDVTPNRVFLTNEDDGANPYQSSAADATNIYVTAVNTKKYQWKAWKEF